MAKKMNLNMPHTVVVGLRVPFLHRHIFQSSIEMEILYSPSRFLKMVSTGFHNFLAKFDFCTMKWRTIHFIGAPFLTKSTFFKRNS